MAIALVTHVATSDTGSADFTTGSIDTTGANLIVVYLAYGGGQTITLTDNKSNTWTPLTNHAENTGGNRANGRFYYVASPTVGTGHTVHIADQTAQGGFSTCCFASFSGVQAATPADVENGFGQSAGSTTIQPGSITPTQAGDLILAGWSLDDPSGNTLSIGSGFTMLDSHDVSTGVYFGGAMAYLVQGSAAAINPTFTRTTTSGVSGGDVAVIASFKAAAGGGSSNPPGLDLAHLSFWQTLIAQ